MQIQNTHHSLAHRLFSSSSGDANRGFSGGIYLVVWFFTSSSLSCSTCVCFILQDDWTCSPGLPALCPSRQEEQQQQQQ